MLDNLDTILQRFAAAILLEEDQQLLKTHVESDPIYTCIFINNRKLKWFLLLHGGTSNAVC